MRSPFRRLRPVRVICFLSVLFFWFGLVCAFKFPVCVRIVSFYCLAISLLLCFVEFDLFIKFTLFWFFVLLFTLGSCFHNIHAQLLHLFRFVLLSWYELFCFDLLSFPLLYACCYSPFAHNIHSRSHVSVCDMSGCCCVSLCL